VIHHLQDAFASTIFHRKNTGSYLGDVHAFSDCIVATVRRDVCPICGDLLKIKSYIQYNFNTAHVQQLSCHITAWVSCWVSYHVFIRILHMHIQSKLLICKLLSILTFICYSGASALRSLFRNIYTLAFKLPEFLMVVMLSSHTEGVCSRPPSSLSL